MDRTPLDGKGRGLESGGSSRSELLVVCMSGCAGPNGFASTLRQVYFVS